MDLYQPNGFIFACRQIFFMATAKSKTTSGKPRTCMTLGISPIHYTGAKISQDLYSCWFFYSHTFKGATIFSKKNCTGVFLISWNLAPENVRTGVLPILFRKISRTLQLHVQWMPRAVNLYKYRQYGVHSSVSFYDLKVTLYNMYKVFFHVLILF